MTTFIGRLLKEIKYLKNSKWSLKEIGEFWDNLEEYDDINSQIYPYKKRFTNSKFLFDQLKIKKFSPKNCLDIQTRTGNGSIFWNNFYPKTKYYIADFSINFLKKSKKNLKNKKITYKDNFIRNFPLPYEDHYFDFVICYETIEHISDYKYFVAELSRVTKSNGIIILTCPNISWEVVHFLAAVLNINHSEGPHTFLKKRLIDNEIKKNKLKVLNYNTSIFLPFNIKISIYIDSILNRITPNFLKKIFFLRHTYILKKK